MVSNPKHFMSILKLFPKSKSQQVGTLLFCLVFGVYLFTCARYHVSMADSDELTLMGYQLSVAHAPGYPIYILIIFLFTHIIPIGTIAFKANLTSVFFQSLTVVIVYATSLEILKNVKLRGIEQKIKKKKYKTFFYYVEETNFENIKIIISAISALFLAFSFLFWFYANTVEVFAMNDFFVILLIYLTLRLTRILYKQKFPDIETKEFNEQRKTTTQTADRIRKWLIWIAIIAGLALSHLQTIVIIYPVIFLYILYIIVRTHIFRQLLSFKTLSYLIIAFLLSFFLPFFLLFFYNNLDHSVSWGLNNNLSGLWSDITRQNYASASSNAYGSSFNFQASVDSIQPYLASVYNDFTYVGLLFASLGAIFLILRNRRLLAYLGSLYLVGGLLFAMYAKFPSPIADFVKHFGDIAIIQRQYIMADVILALFIPVGIYVTFKLLISILSSLNSTKEGEYTNYAIRFATLFLLMIGMVGISYLIRSNYNDADLHTFTYIDQYAKVSLNSMKKNSILVCFSDPSCFSFLYTQQVLGVRNDITIVPADYSLRQSYLDKKPGLQEFYYKTGPYNIADIISWNLYKGKDVYESDVDSEFVNFMGLDGGSFYTLPNGYVGKIVTKIPNSLEIYPYTESISYAEYFNNYTNNGYEFKNYWKKFYDEFFARLISLNSYLHWEEGDNANAVSLSDLAAKLDKSNSLFQQVANNLSHPKNNGPFHLGESSPSSDAFYQNALETIQKQGQAKNAYDFAIRATFLNPFNLNARLIVAQYYQYTKQNNMAKKEYKNILKLDPGNNIAQSALNSLSS